MSLTTDQHRDDLEARRRRKHARAAAERTGQSPPAPQSPSAARGLLDGLITGPPEPAAEADLPPTREPGPEPNTSVAPTTRNAGETVDQLIARVKDATSANAADASTTLGSRRPVGTADLPADAATRPPRRRRGVVARGRPIRISGGPRRWVAALALTAGLAVLVAELPAQGTRSAHRGVDVAMSNAKLAMTHAGNQLDNVTTPRTSRRPTRTVTRPVVVSRGRHAARRPTHRRARRHRPVIHHPTTQTTHAAAVASSQAEASTPTTTPATQTVAPAHAASTTSNEHSSQSTHASPLGGIGSCIQGC
jgi:hypothetical protein